MDHEGRGSRERGEFGRGTEREEVKEAWMRSHGWERVADLRSGRRREWPWVYSTERCAFILGRTQLCDFLVC